MIYFLKEGLAMLCMGFMFYAVFWQMSETIMRLPC